MSALLSIDTNTGDAHRERVQNGFDDHDGHRAHVPRQEEVDGIVVGSDVDEIGDRFSGKKLSKHNVPNKKVLLLQI